MTIDTVRAKINGTWVTLTKNASGHYEANIAAPNITSFNVNSGHYYPVEVEATDLAGNKATVDDTHATLGSQLRLYVKEVTKPTIVITAPSSGAYLSTNTPAITFQLRDETDGSGVKISTLKIQIDDGPIITNTSPGVTITSVSGGYNVTYTPQTALSDGEHIVKINAQDNDGNAATQASRNFTVDTVPPELSVTSPAEGITYRNTPALTVTGVTNDITSSTVVVKINVNGVDQGDIPVDSNGNFSKSVTLTEGENTIVVTATDLAGKTTTVTRTVILDTVAPVVENITIVPNPVNVGQTYTITVEVSD